MNVESLSDPRILVVDDEEANLRLVDRILQSGGYENTELVSDPERAVEAARDSTPDVVLMDLRMPGVDGIELLERLGDEVEDFRYVPVVVLTSDPGRDAERRALRAGADDYLTKPVSPFELRLRLENMLETRSLHLALRDHGRELEERVRERTAELEAAQMETLERLALAAEHRHEATGQHTRRVGELSRELAVRLDLDDRRVEQIRWAAPLHDVGKIGIDDAVLRKPGDLTEGELSEMRQHAAIGAEILSGSPFEVLQLAEKIALHHHERWDGSGYPRGLSGEEIPIAARIVAVADVFDSLTHERVYRESVPEEEALSFVLRGSGSMFDPAVVEALEEIVDGDAVPSVRDRAADARVETRAGRPGLGPSVPRPDAREST